MFNHMRNVHVPVNEFETGERLRHALCVYVRSTPRRPALFSASVTPCHVYVEVHENQGCSWKQKVC